MTLRLQRNDQGIDDFDLEKLGGDEYFSWGEPGLHAGVWKFIVRPGGDVYFFERSLGETIKISLHKSGQWQLAWVYDNIPKNPLVRAAGDERDSRFVDTWTRPVANTLPHLTAYTIFTTGRDLTVWSDSSKVSGRVKWLPPPSGDELALLNLIFLRASGQVVDLRGFVPVAAMAMKTGEALLVLAGRKHPSRQEVETLAHVRQKITDDSIGSGVDKSLLDGSRVLLHRKNNAGGRFALDLAFKPTLPSA